MGRVKKPLLTVLLVSFGAAVIFLFTYTYTVAGRVTDIATKEPVKDLTVSIASRSSKTNEQGQFRITGINLLQRKDLIVEPSSQYEKTIPFDVQYSFRKRSLERNVELEPTLNEMVDRTLVASKNGQYDYMWDFMYPDDKEYWGSKEEYQKLLKERDEALRELGLSYKSITRGENIRQVESWKSPVTGKEYKNVTEVPVEYVTVEDGKESNTTVLQYYSRVDGFYHYFTGLNKEELKKTIEGYSSFKQLFQ